MSGPTANGFTTTTIAIPDGTIPANAIAVGATSIGARWYTRAIQRPARRRSSRPAADGKSYPPLTRIVNPGGTSPCSSGGGATGNGSLAQQFVLHSADVLR